MAENLNITFFLNFFHRNSIVLPGTSIFYRAQDTGKKKLGARKTKIYFKGTNFCGFRVFWPKHEIKFPF